MKKVTSILVSLFVAHTVSVALAQDKLEEHKVTRIFITIEERKEVEPDQLQLRVIITAKKEKEGEVINLLGAIDKEIRALKVDYQGGSYSVDKNCFWEKNKRKCVGYVGNLGYLFNLKESREQNRILEILEAFKEKEGESLDYQVSGPNWIISERHYKEMEKALKLEVLSSAVEFGKRAGERLGRKCEISKVDYEIRGFYWQPPIRPLYKSSGLEVEKARPLLEAPEPKKDDKSINLKAQVNYFCVETK